MYLIMVDISFGEITDDFSLVSAKFKCQILLQGISDATNTVICHAVTIRKLKEKGSLVQFHVLPCN